MVAEAVWRGSANELDAQNGLAGPFFDGLGEEGFGGEKPRGSGTSWPRALESVLP
jgi:hypothetical protein